MLIYQGNKSDFLDMTMKQAMPEYLEKTIYEKMHRKTGKSEIESWKNSLNYMGMVLMNSSLPDSTGIAIEYNIPQTNKRIDFLLSGYDHNEKANAIIVELKQWQQVHKVPGKNDVVETILGNGWREEPHPSYQAWSYAATIHDYNEDVRHKDIGLHPCAYLHNYNREDPDPLFDPQYEDCLIDSPAFTRHEMEKLIQFLERFIVKGDNGDIIYEIDHGKIRPSKSLQDTIYSMVKGNREFVMIDDQKVVYENIVALSEQSKRDGLKRTIIVKGGPGTGKTVVAMNLLNELTGRDQFVRYVTKNSAPRNIYKSKLKQNKMKKSSIDTMFTGSGSFVDCPSNMVDTLLTDEAHRLNAKSGMFKNLGENQIKEIIHAARCSVFFIDEEQRVTLSDIGSIQEIRGWANLEHSQIFEFELTSQFRCNGSDGYLAWLDDVLEIRETANYDLDDIDYDIRILDTPEEVRDLIFEKNKIANKSRLLAGYCWNWIKEGQNTSYIHDINIGNFSMSWNLGNTQTWAIDEESVNEIGCIHTSQGLEFDYAGVIIGEDMRYENGHIVTDYTKRAKTDQSLKGIKKLEKEDSTKAKAIADEIIKNTYRTLMTRGMKGCYVYCCDKQLGEYLKQRIHSNKG